MAGLVLAQGFLGRIDRVVAGLQVEVLLGSGVDPGLGVVRRRLQHRQAVQNAFDGGVLAVGQGDQGLERVIHGALGENAVGAGGVVTGLGFEHVGLVRQAHVETLVGLVQLALERRFLGLGRGQGVLGAQYGEVGFGALQNQVLLGGRELQGVLLIGGLGCLELVPAVGTEQRLAQIGAIGQAAARAVDVTVAGVHLGIGIHAVGAGRQIRQQTGPGLRHHFLDRRVVGTCGGEVGVVLHRFVVDGDQIGLACQGGFFGPGHSCGGSSYCERQRESA